MAHNVYEYETGYMQEERTNLKGFQHRPFSESSEPNPYLAEAAKDTRQKKKIILL